MTLEEFAKLLTPVAEEHNAIVVIPSSKERKERIKMMKPTQWERNAHAVIALYGSHVDWEERFYLCPFCDEPIYECDWSENDLFNFICPICEERIEEEEE